MSGESLSANDFDVLIIGSGFGGSIMALRLVEKGYRVGVLEAGKRHADSDFPDTSHWDIRKSLWQPGLGWHGPTRMDFLPHTMLLRGVGVGGGSLVYGNVLLEPADSFYRHEQWAAITDWRDELAPHLNQASRMLGAQISPRPTTLDVHTKAVAAEMGRADTYRPIPVAVHFGKPGEKAPDPYFGGIGPERTGCTECGGCCAGCRVGAKNTLVKNYLYLAEKAGATVIPLTTATKLVQLRDGRWIVSAKRSGSIAFSKPLQFTADQVVVSAGAWGTAQLLHRQKLGGTLPRLSSRLGALTRTNSQDFQALSRELGDPSLAEDRGVLTGAAFDPDGHTTVESFYLKNFSKVVALLAGLPGRRRTGAPSLSGTVWQTLRHPRAYLSTLKALNSGLGYAVIVMQSIDTSFSTHLKCGLFGRRLTSTDGANPRNPKWHPIGVQVCHELARETNSRQLQSWPSTIGLPVTVHFFGGAVIGATPRLGVVDPYHRVWGYPTLSVVDGSTLVANIGLNPSLTIAALAERAASLWPNKNEADPRPPQDQPYQRLRPVFPQRPIVPAGAPAALPWPNPMYNEKDSVSPL